MLALCRASVSDSFSYDRGPETDQKAAWSARERRASKQEKEEEKEKEAFYCRLSTT